MGSVTGCTPIVKQKMPTGGYFLFDAAKAFAAQINSNNFTKLTMSLL